VLRLARLAVDESPRGHGVGSALLRHVFILALKMSEEYGCVGVLVDAKPDAVVVFARIPRDHEGPLDRVPELCVEVLSTDRTHDRVTKRLLYAASGVREYWVVEPSGLIERWSGPGLAQAEEVREILTTPLLPGFSLDLAALFAE
jgi:Uma2 family endonuclease